MLPLWGGCVCGHPSGLGAWNCGPSASPSPVVQGRDAEMVYNHPGFSQRCFVETGVSALAPQPRSPSTSCSGCGGRSEPCDSPFQTLTFFLLQQARPPEPPARCWPPWPCPPGLCSPRWTSSTCSPSTSMAPPRSISSPTSARYGLGGWVGGVQPSMGVGWEGGLPGVGSQKLGPTRSNIPPSDQVLPKWGPAPP